MVIVKGRIEWSKTLNIPVILFEIFFESLKKKGINPNIKSETENKIVYIITTKSGWMFTRYHDATFTFWQQNSTIFFELKGDERAVEKFMPHFRRYLGRMKRKRIILGYSIS